MSAMISRWLYSAAVYLSAVPAGRSGQSRPWGPAAAAHRCCWSAVLLGLRALIILPTLFLPSAKFLIPPLSDDYIFVA